MSISVTVFPFYEIITHSDVFWTVSMLFQFEKGVFQQLCSFLMVWGRFSVASVVFDALELSIREAIWYFGSYEFPYFPQTEKGQSAVVQRVRGARWQNLSTFHKKANHLEISGVRDPVSQSEILQPRGLDTCSKFGQCEIIPTVPSHTHKTSEEIEKSLEVSKSNNRNPM